MASDTDTARADPLVSFPALGPADSRDRVEVELREAQAIRGPAERLGEFGRFIASFRRSLTRRIVAINLAGLAALVAAVLYLNQLRTELIEVRVDSLEAQAEILATAIAEIAAVAPDEPKFDIYAANEMLRQLTLETGQRAQIYISGRLMGDTRSFSGTRARMRTRELPPLQGASGLLGWIEELYSRAARQLQKANLPLYIETPNAGITEDTEVYDAQRGQPAHALRANSEGELIVSVAVPIRRLKVVTGVLVLSTVGGDIDRVIRAGRIEILRVFLLSSIIAILLSVLLANGIARPLRRLAQAADEAGINTDRLAVSERTEIPDLSARGDEIGQLSTSMRRMTDALYTRIEAIESFAADVAHEIKNPLTSLRSATETLDYAKTESARERLYAVIRDDVDRLDRLVTDISNASRLDAELVREARAPFDIGALVETTADILRAEAQKRNVEITTLLDTDARRIRGLESRVAQVLHNLIENALSFSPEGGSVRVTLQRDAANAALLTVEDDGPGIPADNLETIFERFYTERPETEAFGRHSGLGLSISKQIVEAHGGTIHAENRRAPETGARFIVSLPA